MHTHAHVLLPNQVARPAPRRELKEELVPSPNPDTLATEPGEAYLHLEEGRPKRGPPADPFEEGHFGLLYCLVLVLVIGQKDVLGDIRASEGLSGGQGLSRPSTQGP